MLVVSTGLTGKVTMHDVPAKNDDGSERFSAPLINVLARSASSIDNAHAVSFFLINDEGTWLIKHARNQDALALLSKLPPRWEDWSEADWLAAAASLKHRLYKERLDFPAPLALLLHLEPPALEPSGHDDSSADRRSHAADDQRHHQPAVGGGWPAAAVRRRLAAIPPAEASRLGRVVRQPGRHRAEHLVSDHRRRATRHGATGSTTSIRRRSGLPARCGPITRRSSSCRT